jgi:hypothetical protein
MRQRQLGYWHLFGIALILGLVDLVAALIRTFRKRMVADGGGGLVAETPTSRARRIAWTLGPHILGWGLVIGCFWAIVHFGPLKPVHEWFQ